MSAELLITPTWPEIKRQEQPGKDTDKLQVHLIGHGHIDRPWLWPRRESIHEALLTFRSAIQRMKEYRGFKFSASTSANYEDVERNDPRLFKKIKKKVDRNEWELLGGKVVEADCNIPSGEFRIRQGLYGKRFFYEKFGKVVDVAFEPDGFGFSEEAKIDAALGFKYFAFMRPQRHEMGLPHGPFILEGEDGSTVVAQRIAYDYNAGPNDFEPTINRTLRQHDGESKQVLVPYGVGDHGGGPTKKTIEQIPWIKKRLKDKAIFKFSTIKDFFKAVEEENVHLPTINEASAPIQPHSVGCYSAGTEIKFLNRRAENEFISAEKLSTVANIIHGVEYPAAELKKSGKTICEMQFHDTMGATLAKEDLEAAEISLLGTIGSSMELKDRAVTALAASIKIEQEEGALPIIATNPNTWQNKSPVEMEVGASKVRRGTILVDNKGNIIPFQIVQSNTASGGRERISFIADLPSLGYKVYKLNQPNLPPLLSSPPLPSGEVKEERPMEASDNSMENDRYRLELDEKGDISRLIDKEHGLDLTPGPFAVPIVMKDTSDTWSHGVYTYDGEGEPKGRFVATQPPKLVENGEVKSVIRVKSAYGDSKMTQNITMYKDLDAIRIDVRLDWHEKHKIHRLEFPMNFDRRETTFETPYGSIVRPENGLEVPGQSWVDTSGAVKRTNIDAGISIINNGKYAYDLHGNKLGMTIIRSAIYANHDPYKEDPEKDYEFMDQGIHEYSYLIYPHKESWKEAETPKRAAEFNQPSILLSAGGNEEGTLPQEYSFAEVEAKNIMLTDVKRAEDPKLNALVLRLHETDKLPTKTKVRVGEREIDVEMKPSGIKTILLPLDKNLPYFETDASELKGIIK